MATLSNHPRLPGLCLITEQGGVASPIYLLLPAFYIDRKHLTKVSTTMNSRGQPLLYRPFPKLKLRTQVARKSVLQAGVYTGDSSLGPGLCYVVTLTPARFEYASGFGILCIKELVLF